MAKAVKMVTVNGVRYRVEDAPEKVEKVDEPTRDPSVKRRTTARNKARTPDESDNK